jgi:hypothetical protein
MVVFENAAGALGFAGSLVFICLMAAELFSSRAAGTRLQAKQAALLAHASRAHDPLPRAGASLALHQQLLKELALRKGRAQ